MGMFDWVDYACTCDNCKSKVTGFQTKSGDNVLDTVKPLDVVEFYSSCDNCGCLVEFCRLGGGKFKKVTSRFSKKKKKVLSKRIVTIKTLKNEVKP